MLRNRCFFIDNNLHFNIFIYFSCTKGSHIVMTAWTGHFIPFLSRSIGCGLENVLFVKHTQPGKWYLFLSSNLLVFSKSSTFHFWYFGVSYFKFESENLHCGGMNKRNGFI